LRLLEKILPVLIYVNVCGLIFFFFLPALPGLGVPQLSPMWLLVPLFGLLVALVVRQRKKWPGLLRQPRFKRWALLFLGILLLQALTRLPHLVYDLAFLNADKSVTLLMVKHIGAGTDFPIYFYGQFYQGTPHVYLYALIHLLVPSLKVSLLLGNMIIFSLFVLVGSRLIDKITRSGSYLTSILILSLPLAGLNFLGNDEIRGFALIALLQVSLAFLVFLAIFEGRRPFFTMGLVAGLLFWTYQPALIFMAVVLVWLFSALLVRREIKLFFLAGLRICAGLFLGGLPHLLAEINNAFVNTRGLFLSGSIFDRIRLFPEGFPGSIASAVLTDLDTSRLISWVLAAAFVFGLSVSIYLFIKKREARTLYLPVIFVVSLILLALSNYPPTARYIAHYKLYCFLTFLILIVPFNALRPLLSRGFKIAFVLIFALFTCFRTAAQFEPASRSHRYNQGDIAALNALPQRLLLGNYWNTMRWQPFGVEDKIFAAVPRAVQPNSVLTFAKYYPHALELGEQWPYRDAAEVFILHRHRERELDQLLADFDIDCTKRRLPSGRYLLCRDFSRRLSPAFYDLMIQRRASRYARDKRASYRSFKGIISEISPVPVEGNRITLKLPGFHRSLLKNLTGKQVKDWRFVLTKGNRRIGFPLDFSKTRLAYTFPAYVAVEPGEYRQYVTFMDTPVRDLGLVQIAAEEGPRTRYLVMSRLRDRAFYGPLPEPEGGKRFKRGLPMGDLALTVLSADIAALGFRVYSVFDFDSSIWNRRLQQVLFINDRAFPLRPGGNLVTLPLNGETDIRLKTKYNSLLNIVDSKGNVQFVNSGALLTEIVLYLKNGTVQVIPPFLREAK
jgi:hypothetical protein